MIVASGLYIGRRERIRHRLSQTRVDPWLDRDRAATASAVRRAVNVVLLAGRLLWMRQSDQLAGCDASKVRPSTSRPLSFKTPVYTPTEPPFQSTCILKREFLSI